MKIFVNHQPTEIVEPIPVSTLVEQLQPTKPFAIAVNLQFLARPLYASTWVQENDRIEIISPVTGG